MPLVKEDIEKLKAVRQEYCISIFIPTHRAGEKVMQQQNALSLKNELKFVKNKLRQKDMHADAITDLLEPIHKLIDDSSFWRNQSDGLAIFIANGFFEKYTLPVHFEEFHYISDAFYLKPLMPMFVGDGNFYLMLLERRNVKLYECTRHSFTEFIIDDLIPESKRDRVGYDYEEKNLQFRTSQAGSGQALYHGQEAATGKRKNEIKKYFRAINDGIHPLIQENDFPMLVVAQDFLFDIYKDVNSYSNLMENSLNVDFDDTDIFEIHEMAWEIMAPVFDQKRKDKIAQFVEVEGSGQTAIGIDRIVPAAIQGKIDSLFCENLEDILGVLNMENNNIIAKPSEEDDHTISLMNVAAINTFLNGGDVYLLEKDDMPNPNSRINALYRY